MTIEKEKLQKIVAIAIGATCVAVAYYQFVIEGFQLSAIRKLQTEVTSLQDKISKAKDNEKKLVILSNTSKQDEPFLAAQETKIVKGDQIAWLWREMCDFADKRKMNRLAVVPESPTPNGLPDNDVYEATGASLNMYCGYHKLGEFMRDLENLFSTLQVQHVEIIGGGEATPDSHTVRVQFQLLALKDEKPDASKVAQSSSKE